MTASVGGAGGSDALGLVLLLQYLNLNDIVVDCTVYEYELGWHTAVHALAATPLVRRSWVTLRDSWVTLRSITSPWSGRRAVGAAQLSMQRKRCSKPGCGGRCYYTAYTPRLQLHSLTHLPRRLPAQMATHRVEFAPCDLCADMHAAVNVHWRDAPLDLVVAAYCLVENAVALRRHRFRFVRALLLAAAQRGTAVLLLDSSWKLWCVRGGASRAPRVCTHSYQRSPPPRTHRPPPPTYPSYGRVVWVPPSSARTWLLSRCR